MARIANAFVLSIILSMFGTSVMGEDRTVEAYPMEKARYEQLKPALEAVKSKKGKMTYVANKLLVVDLPKVQKLVREIVDKTATPAVNVMVTVDFQNVAMIKERGLKISGTFKATRTGGQPKIKGDVDVDVKNKKRRWPATTA